jgi:hypothetical protein
VIVAGVTIVPFSLKHMDVAKIVGKSLIIFEFSGRIDTGKDLES